jgi:hypothetical protein
MSPEQIRFWALECLVRSDEQATVRKSLRLSGYTREEADSILRDATELSTQDIARTVTPEARTAARVFLIVAGIVLLGILASCESMFLAVQSGARLYYVFNGVIVIGLLIASHGMWSGGFTTLAIWLCWRAGRICFTRPRIALLCVLIKNSGVALLIYADSNPSSLAYEKKYWVFGGLAMMLLGAVIFASACWRIDGMQRYVPVEDDIRESADGNDSEV